MVVFKPRGNTIEAEYPSGNFVIYSRNGGFDWFVKEPGEYTTPLYVSKIHGKGFERLDELNLVDFCANTPEEAIIDLMDCFQIQDDWKIDEEK